MAPLILTNLPEKSSVDYRERQQRTLGVVDAVKCTAALNESSRFHHRFDKIVSKGLWHAREQFL